MMDMDKGEKQYDAPEPREETQGKAVAYLVLGALVVVILVLVATGVVDVF